jgi:hypothetical protein
MKTEVICSEALLHLYQIIRRYNLEDTSPCCENYKSHVAFSVRIINEFIISGICSVVSLQMSRHQRPIMLCVDSDHSAVGVNGCFRTRQMFVV